MACGLYIRVTNITSASLPRGGFYANSKSIEMMRKYDKMTEEDWNIAEMATSDEEEPEEQVGLAMPQRRDQRDTQLKMHSDPSLG